MVHTVESDYRGNTIKEYTNGALKRTSHYYTNGTLRSTTDALDNTTKYGYNGLGKAVKTLVPFAKDASGNIVYSVTENTYDKNGNVTLVKQTVNEQSAAAAYSYTANTYDAQGRLIQVHQYGDADSAETIAKYFYNADGVLTEMQTGASSADYLSTTYTYDAWNRLVTTNESTGYCSGSMTYDRNGNVLTSTDANGYVTTNTYDALNRVVSSETETGNSSKDVSKSTYYNNMGQVSRTVCNGQTTWYTYDLMGRLIQESGTQFTGYYYVGSSESLARTVTGKSNLLMYSTISYTYDSEMRLATVSANGDLTATYAYDANGNKLSETLANGVVTSYSYNNANRITDLVSAKNGETIESYHYTYYLDGSDAQKTSVVDGVESTTAYTYDGICRLASETVTNGNTETVYSCTYDQFGNRASMTVSGDTPYTTTYHYNDADGNYTGLLQSETKILPEVENLPLIPDANIQVTLYTYDANGNQLTVTDYEGKVKNYAYDGLNQLISYSDDENTASYTYRMDGMRRSKTVNGTTITHIWVGGQIVADVTGNYTATCYVRGTNLLAQYEFNYGASDDYTYYLQNAHGDVTALLDTAGELTKSYVYDAFGVEQNIDDSDSNAFRYCGEYYDAETGTVYLRARYYNPVIGRFISRDTYTGEHGDPLSLNLYTYCKNSPILYDDLDGHSPIAIPMLALAAAAVLLVTTACVIMSTPAWQQSLASASNTLERSIPRVLEVPDAIALPREITIAKSKEHTLPPDTVIYRWGSNSSTNLTPKTKDITTGLSFSLTPPTDGRKFVTTTIGTVNSTGVLSAIPDGPNHVSVRPNGTSGSLAEWIATGPSHPYTSIMQSIVIPYNGKHSKLPQFSTEFGFRRFEGDENEE